MAVGAPWRLVGLTPHPCPGCAVCGMSRAFTALSHGELARAVEFNAGVLLFYPAFWAVVVLGCAVAAQFLVRRLAPRRSF